MNEVYENKLSVVPRKPSVVPTFIHQDASSSNHTITFFSLIYLQLYIKIFTFFEILNRNDCGLKWYMVDKDFVV